MSQAYQFGWKLYSISDAINAKFERNKLFGGNRCMRYSGWQTVRHKKRTSMSPTPFASTLVSLTLLAWLSSLATGQTVQLPTFGHTAIKTSVSVPVGGSVLLGGSRTGNDGRTVFRTPLLPGFGGLAPRAVWTSRSAGSMSVQVSVHDFAATDKALRQQASAHKESRKPSRTKFWHRQAAQTRPVPFDTISRNATRR